MKEKQDIQISITRIWQILSHVRGWMSNAQLLQVATAFIFLRRIDCLISKYAKDSASFYSQNNKRLSDERLAEKLCEISGGYPFYNYSGYTFNGILKANNSIEVVMNSYLQGFSKNVQAILNEMDFNHHLAIMLRQSRCLVEMFDFFSNIDLSASSVDNGEFVQLVMFLLSDITTLTNNTPLGLSNLICECLLAKDVRKSKEDVVSIYDPVCGTGSLLANAGEVAKSFAINQENISLYGQDIYIFSAAVAKVLVLLSGNKDSKVCYGDTLTEDQFKNHHFQYILADMPLGLQWRSIKDRIERESLDVNGRFTIGLPSYSDSQFLFIEHILSKMDPNGCRAAFITSSSILYGGSASSGESRIRRWLFENDMVETIIALPGGVLENTNIPVCLWIISNVKEVSQKGYVHLIDFSNQEKNSIKACLEKNYFQSVLDEYKSKVVSSMSQIVKNEQLGFYEVKLLENDVKKEVVTISLDTKIEEFIEKDRQPFAKGKITVDYSSVEKGYSVIFDDFFKKDDIEVTSLKETTSDVLSIIEAINSIKPFVQQISERNETSSVSETWHKLPLRAAIEITSGTNRVPVLNKEGLPLLSVSYLRNPSSSERYEVTPKTRCATSNDVIVIIKGANIGEVFKGTDGILSPSVASIRCSDENIIYPKFLYYLLKANESTLMRKTKGNTIKSLDVQMILDHKCLLPPIEEQKRISSYLDPIVDEIDIIMERLKSSDNTFAVFRQALIENVVCGKFRI